MYHRSTVNPLLSPPGGYLFQAYLRGSLIETEGIFEKGGGGSLSNLETTMVSVLQKEQEYKVVKFKYKTFRRCSQGLESNPIFQLVNNPFRISPHDGLQS